MNVGNYYANNSNKMKAHKKGGKRMIYGTAIIVKSMCIENSINLCDWSEEWPLCAAMNDCNKKNCFLFSPWRWRDKKGHLC